MSEQTDTEPQVATQPRIRLDVDQLTPRDMKRARVVLDGRNPFELLDDPIDRIVLLIWCLRSRDDPSFTWEQAEATPFSEVEPAGDSRPPPPSEATSFSSGSTPAAKNGSRPKRSPSSAATTG